MNKNLFKKVLVLTLVVTAYTTPYHLNAQDKKSTMKPFITIFEIPATNISRAVEFYQSILGVSIETIEMQGTQMGLFPSDGQSASGVITQGEGYTPSADGVIIYLNGGNDLQPMLDKVVPSGGEVIVPKTRIDEENGYFALFLDSEGNRIGLHSIK